VQREARGEGQEPVDWGRRLARARRLGASPAAVIAQRQHAGQGASAGTEAPARSPLVSSSLPAFATVVQRAPVAPVTYLTNIIATDSADPEWDPHWTAGLTKVSTDASFLATAGATLDDASEGDVLKLIGVLKALAGLSSDRPNPFRSAIAAVRWHAGIESDSGGSGFGDLDTSGTPLTGRPAFPKITQVNIPLRSGQHRRHILAWHTIREFVSKMYAAQRPVVIETIWKMQSDPPDETVAQAFAEGFQHVVSGREKSGAGSGMLNDGELLKVGLFVMNGNPRNLWGGKGSTNSALNTAQMHMNAALEKVTGFAGFEALVKTWSDAKGKAVYQTATDLGAQVLSEAANTEWLAWQATNDPTKEEDYVQNVIRKVQAYVISNLETDVMGDSKVQNEIAVEKYDALKDPIALIDNVASGLADPSEVPPEIVAEAMRQFMTYEG
jgi:hypothetical protein